MIFDNTEMYVNSFYESFEKIYKKRKSESLKQYINHEIKQLRKLVESVTISNFWQVIPRVLGIDAKLSIVLELIRFEDFSEEDIIRITESDYKSYFKELCGYTLDTETNLSIVFNVL